jgi:hypothetical protein
MLSESCKDRNRERLDLMKHSRKCFASQDPIRTSCTHTRMKLVFSLQQDLIRTGTSTGRSCNY